MNVGTLVAREYSCSPREAVIAAYAQSKGDWNTWEYEEKYGALVHETPLGFYVRDFGCLKDQRENDAG